MRARASDSSLPTYGDLCTFAINPEASSSAYYTFQERTENARDERYARLRNPAAIVIKFYAPDYVIAKRRRRPRHDSLARNARRPFIQSRTMLRVTSSYRSIGRFARRAHHRALSSMPMRMISREHRQQRRRALRLLLS